MKSPGGAPRLQCAQSQEPSLKCDVCHVNVSRLLTRLFKKYAIIPISRLRLLLNRTSCSPAWSLPFKRHTKSVERLDNASSLKECSSRWSAHHAPPCPAASPKSLVSFHGLLIISLTCGYIHRQHKDLVHPALLHLPSVKSPLSFHIVSQTQHDSRRCKDASPCPAVIGSLVSLHVSLKSVTHIWL